MPFRKSRVTLSACFGVIVCGMLVGDVRAFDGKNNFAKPVTNRRKEQENFSEVSSERRSSLRYSSLAGDVSGGYFWSTTGDIWSSSEDTFPAFDDSSPSTVTTQLGQTAYLRCTVKNLADKTVSWIRRKDFNVLTVGLDTYTNDDRFQTTLAKDTGEWTLQIRYAQLEDEGTYECQVGSDPKISFFVNLTVLVAKAAIEGAPDIYVKSGSSIDLTCLIIHSPSPPLFVFWYHDDRMINYDNSRGLIATLQKGTAPDTAVSKLSVANVQPSDAGNYTCCPSNAEATSITLHVLNGEKPAAIQHDANPPLSGAHSVHQWISAFYRSYGIILLFLLIAR